MMMCSVNCDHFLFEIVMKRQRPIGPDLRYASFMPRAKRFRSNPPRYRNTRTGGFLGIENKFLDCAWNLVQVNTSTDGSGGELQPSSGCTNSISVPAQGDGEQERDGRKYVLTECWVSGVVEVGSDTDNPDPGELPGTFFALVLDTQTNGSAINSEDVYINPSTRSEAMMPQPLRNLQNSKRFRILDSKYIPAGGGQNGTDGTNTVSIAQQVRPSVSLNWSGKLVCDSLGTTANVSAAADNSLHVIAFSEAGTATVSFHGKSRIRFQG